ncbi:hypothetical protein N0V93_001195 [Gnomoniopsis smithogilvyi]|uniref:Amine oxidase domain-containing protein n=1 Tax=Gnomoniopsis smithogilvyi TaxID=1191159 RepID=A0A9W8Z5G4_9PEZI|nr:hypothetical protein N0V93_001195 [Gnomoniopsis smithogilvyi]
MAATRSRHYDTLVLGAGMSGLACASRLYQHSQYKDGQRSLLVLEGRERIGGRIDSVHVHGCRLDTGANWIHGVGTQEMPNPLMGVLPHKRLRQLSGSIIFNAPPVDDPLRRSSDASPEKDGWISLDSVPPLGQSTCHEGRRSEQTIPPEMAAKLMGSLWSMIGALNKAAVQAPTDDAKHTTMLKAITQTDEFRQAFETLPQEYHHSLRALPQFMENMEAAPLAAQSAEKSSDQPGMGLLEFALDDFDGDQMFLRDGYTAVVEEVAKELTQAGLIQLGVEVQQIDWSRNPIVVKTSHGSYTAKQVVCSLPLGILQHHSREVAPLAAPAPLFVPPLSAEKKTTIDSLGYGTLDKIMLIYERPWWTEEPYLSILKKGLFRQPLTTETIVKDGVEKQEDLPAPDTMMGFTDELPGIEVDDDGTLHSGLRFLTLLNLDNLTGFPVLSAFVSCANAVQAEAMTNEQAGGIVHRALTSWLGREPAKPKGIHVTRWASDEFSRGSYSHMITGLSEPKHREEFQRPVVNREGGILRFAGEHTS